MQYSAVFQSFFMGGFECSSHLRPDNRRLDLIAATEHDRYAQQDYALLRRHGMATVRDGFRWHLIEQRAGQYDFASARPLVQAAQATGMQVIWDLCHYGWPADLDVFGPQFVARYAAFVRAAATFIANEADGVPFYAPINEISFLAWAGGDANVLNPYSQGRGFELKVQLVRAAIAGIEAIWSVDPRARIVHADPLLHITADRYRPHEHSDAEGHRLAQYQAWDMLAGRMWPQLGGDPRYLDIVGVNYYPSNQWINGGPPIDRFHGQYRWFSQMLGEVYERYGRPVLVAETGCEGAARSEWLAYIGREVRLALRAGVPVAGVCLYPVLDYPGWDDERHCRTGLLSYTHAGERVVDAPLAAELTIQQRRIAASGFVAPGQVSRSDDDSRPTLCLYTESTVPSGLGETMLTLADALQDEMQVALVCPAEEGGAQLLERAAALGVETFALPLQGEEIATDVLRHWLRARRIDLFHCHAGIGWEGLRGVVVAHGVGVRAIVRSEHLPYLLEQPQDQQAYQRTLGVLDQVVCVSEEVQRSLREAGVPEQLLKVVHRARTLPSARLDAAVVRAKLGLKPDDRLVLTVGRLAEQKGHAVLVQAIARLAARGALERTHFVWLGDGPLGAKLRQAVRDAGIQARVHFLSHSDDVAGLVQAADLAVLPSRFEGMPLALLEAMAAGVPVVASAVGGIAEVIEDGISGRLVPRDNPEQLADAIAEALAPRSRAQDWGIAGRKRAERFGVSQMLAGMREVYNEVLAQTDAAASGA